VSSKKLNWLVSGGDSAHVTSGLGLGLQGALASGSPADKIQHRDAGQQVSAGTSSPPVSG